MSSELEPIRITCGLSSTGELRWLHRTVIPIGSAAVDKQAVVSLFKDETGKY